VDDVGRVAAFEGGDELVVDVVPAALDVGDLDVRVGLVPLLDQLLVGRDRLLLPGEAEEVELDGLVRGGGGPAGPAAANADLIRMRAS
jgi:hypothetical protein